MAGELKEALKIEVNPVQPKSGVAVKKYHIYITILNNLLIIYFEDGVEAIVRVAMSVLWKC